jgi:hypothetical protein
VSGWVHGGQTVSPSASGFRQGRVGIQMPKKKITHQNRPLRLIGVIVCYKLFKPKHPKTACLRNKRPQKSPAKPGF